MCSMEDTQSNESFHSLKTRFASNHINWGISWKLRMCLAVVKWNLGECSRQWIDGKLGIKNSNICYNILSKMKSILMKRRIKSNSYEYQHHRNLQ